MKKLIIVDISSFIFRAFFAIRPMTAPNGKPVNAVYGVLSMLLKMLASNNPSHIILARDTKGGSFRNELYDQYKANRGEPPEDLVPQFALINELIEKMGIPHKAIENYEADDVIGSLVVQFKDKFNEVLIASGDKDLMQFIDDNVVMVDTMKGKRYGRQEVFEKMGVYPEQIVDYLSLLGDSSDNIPGVKGIGAKGAANLLKEYATGEELLKNIDSISNKRAKTALEKHHEDFHLSKSLVKIVTDLKLDLSVEAMEYKLQASEELLNFLDELNFKTMKAKIGSGTSEVNFTPQRSFFSYDIVATKKIPDLLESLRLEDNLYIEAYLDDDDYHSLTPHLYGVATGKKVYLIYNEQLAFKDFMKHCLGIKDINLVALNSKIFQLAATEFGLESEANCFDLLQAHFVLDPEKKHTLESIAKEFLRENLLTLKELRKENFDDIQSQKKIEAEFAKRLYCGLRVFPWLQKNLQKAELWKVYNEIDLPTQGILAKMEAVGVEVDKEFFSELEDELTKTSSEILTQIQSVAGTDINLKSPKQVGVLLFETLELPVIKKTKTGYSTDVSVLEELDSMGESEIPGLIIKYREVEKLLSTYVKTLPTLVGEDKKIHTHFNQHVAQTGRLSSDKPNLQNIPIRTENGRKVRRGFIPSKGTVLLGADYSQVELRLLAHFSEDQTMIEAFNNDEDIHAQTASEIFDIDLKDVSKEQRSYAKAINFGLMYGQSSFGLSQMLKISRGEAKDYITKYFERFSSVKSYLDSLKEECEKTGYAKTLFGRKRFISDINSTNRQMKAMAERMAINSPIQGTAADIIKKAMINLDKKMSEEKLKSKMILQVHDELIFEVPENEVDIMKSLVREEMENVVELKVPLRVDMGTGPNWFELK